MQDAVGGKTHVVEIAAEFVRNLQPTAAFVKGLTTVTVAAGTVDVVAIATSAKFLPVTQPTALVGQVITANA